jgi:hypothetical protein
MPSLDWVLEKARAAVVKFGVRGLVLDPYNELDHSRPQGKNEHEVGRGGSSAGGGVVGTGGLGTGRGCDLARDLLFSCLASGAAPLLPPTVRHKLQPAANHSTPPHPPRQPPKTAPQYISEFMARLRQFAKSNGVHVFLVAHPKQRANWRGEVGAGADLRRRSGCGGSRSASGPACNEAASSKPLQVPAAAGSHSPLWPTTPSPKTQYQKRARPLPPAGPQPDGHQRRRQLFR